MARLTKKVIEALLPRQTEFFVWDGEMGGRFGIRVLPSGRKSFVVQYRLGRRSRRMNIGLFGVLTPEVARARAMQALGKVAAGIDPAEEKKAQRDAITVRELALKFDVRHIDLNPRLKASTGREYRHAITRGRLVSILNLQPVPPLLRVCDTCFDELSQRVLWC